MAYLYIKNKTYFIFGFKEKLMECEKKLAAQVNDHKVVQSDMKRKEDEVMAAKDELILNECFKNLQKINTLHKKTTSYTCAIF